MYVYHQNASEAWLNYNLETDLISLENYHAENLTNRLRRKDGGATLISKISEMDLLREKKIDKLYIQTIETIIDKKTT